VVTVPPANAPDAWSRPGCAWLSQHRQIIETTFAFLKDVFAIKHLQAHSRWGQLTRWNEIDDLLMSQPTP
jgi:hypothetical protein